MSEFLRPGEDNQQPPNIDQTIPTHILGSKITEKKIEKWQNTVDQVRRELPSSDRICIVRDYGTIGDGIINTFAPIAVSEILTYLQKDTPIDIYAARGFASLYKGFEEHIPNSRVIPVDNNSGLLHALTDVRANPDTRKPFIFDFGHFYDPKHTRPIEIPALSHERPRKGEQKEIAVYHGDLFRNAAYRYKWDDFQTHRFQRFMQDITGQPDGVVTEECLPKIYLPSDHETLANNIVEQCGISLDTPQIPIVATSTFPGKRYGRWPEVINYLSQTIPDAQFLIIAGNTESEFFANEYQKIAADPNVRNKVHMVTGSLLELAAYYQDANILTAASNDTGVGPHLMAASSKNFSVVVPYGPFIYYAPENWTWSDHQIPVSLGYKLPDRVADQSELNNTQEDRRINLHDPSHIAEVMLGSIDR